VPSKKTPQAQRQPARSAPRPWLRTVALPVFALLVLAALVWSLMDHGSPPPTVTAGQAPAPQGQPAMHQLRHKGVGFDAGTGIHQEKLQFKIVGNG